MPTLADAMTDNQRAVERFAAACRAVPASSWPAPTAPGKWSPAQIAEHVALAYELSRKALTGSFPGTSAPAFLRPLIRRFFLAPVLRRGAFGRRAKAPGVFLPGPVSSTPESAAARVIETSAAFEQLLADTARSGGDSINHPFFGTVALADYLRLQAIHTNHHLRQLPGAGTP